MSEPMSIHPRVMGGSTRYEKSHTNKKPQRSTVERKIAGIERHLSEHPNNSVAQGHLQKLQAKLRSI